jgi:hypothetical protein
MLAFSKYNRIKFLFNISLTFLAGILHGNNFGKFSLHVGIRESMVASAKAVHLAGISFV